MAANLRFEASSGSPDGAQFMGGISNCHTRTLVDRSTSFRGGDSHDARAGAGGGAASGASGGAAAAGQQGGAGGAGGEPLSQLLSLEPIPLGEQKYHKQLELKRVTTAILEDPAQLRSIDNLGVEELKKVKLSISENSCRARDRSRYMSEAIGKLDRYRSSLLSKKRAKPESATPGASPPVTVKAPAGAGQTEVVKPPEKSKGLVPNKRLRTSIADGARPSNPSVKKSGDRESPRSSSVLLPSPTEDKGLEKNKLKGRRSAIKVDQSSALVTGNGVLEGERDHKWTGQHRLSQEARSRINETHGLRSGPVHGVTSIHKAEALQMNGSVSQRNLCKGDEASGEEKTDRFPGPDKDRVPKNGLKPSLPDDTHMPTITKGKASRTPRTSTATHLSHLNRASTLAAAEKPQSSTKVQLPTGQNNRKRPAPSRSSSPVAQWGGQRPQKMARVARRVHVPPGGALPPAEEPGGSTLPEAIPERAPGGVGVRFSNGAISGAPAPRRLQAGSPHFPGSQSKSRAERGMASMVVSESEESEEAASESKVMVKEKGKKQGGGGEWEHRGVLNQKTSLVLPAKASSSAAVAALKDEMNVSGDGVRRQGRSGRNFCMPKAPVVNPVDKVDVATSTAKQLRSARTEKADRPGRTPSKKATGDRKSLTRIRRPPPGAAADIGLLNSPGEPEDDHDELLSAVRAAVDASADACSSDFWKEMEPYFAFLTADDLSYLRQLGDSKWNNDVLSTLPTAAGDKISNGALEHEAGDRSEIRSGGRSGGGGGWNDKIYPLSQRLLAALINEEDEALDGLGDGCNSSGLQEQKFMSGDGGFYPNGNHSPFYDDAGDAGDDILAESRPDASRGGFDASQQLCGGFRSASTWENQDEQQQQLSVDERILLELRSIGLVVEQVPDLSQRDEDELCVQISKLKEELKDQVAINRQRVATLEKSVVAKRETEMRDRERLAVSKLVEFAYTRKKGWRGNSSVAKGAGNKGTKAAFLAFSRRALARVRRFEAGHSCIVDPGLRDILFCNLSKSSKASAGGANSADTSVTPGVSETSAQKSAEHTGKLVLRRSDSKPELAGEHRAREVSWAPWKESSTEDITGATSTRNGVGFGGTKGKRSERDGKGQGKESHRKAENERIPRPLGGNNASTATTTTGTIKGERKTKTKPRNKAAPLFKDVNGLGKPAEVKPLAEPPPPAAPPLLEVQSSLSVSMEASLDLTQLAIPEDLGVHDENIGAWLALEDASLQDQGELLMGLDVPMDDLSDLGMMM